MAGVTGEAVAGGDGARLSEDLHLDSLGRVELLSAVEQRFGVELEDDAVAAVGTVGELRELVERELVGAAGEKQGEKQIPFGNDNKKSKGKGEKQIPSLRYGMTNERDAAVDGGGGRVETDPTINARSARVDHGAPDLVGEHVYPRWPWWWWVRWVRVVWIEAVMRPLVWLLARPRVVVEDADPTRDGETVTDGAPDVVTESGPCLIIANHVTAYDGALVLYALPGKMRRRVAAAMSGEMLLDYRRARGQGNWALNVLAPGAYWLLTALFNVFPLPHARGFRRSFAHAGEAMDEGYSVLIFPEGMRSRTGTMGRFRAGIGLLARETEAAVVPVGLRGLYEARGWFRSGRIEVRVGRPIAAANDATDAAELTARLEAAVRGLVGGLER
jgi:long-chain acyl-CoA synthetase